MTHYHNVATWIGLGVDGIGVLVIVAGTFVASARYVFGRQATTGGRSHRAYRQELARAILLGLELLIAGDIIRTVAVQPTLESVTILGAIVLIRTFLNMTLQLEVEGHWPWQRASRTAAAPEPDA
jgi:uncharacterized membrane protein